MVDTNQEPAQNEDSLKKKKPVRKKAEVKTKADDKPARKDNKPAKVQAAGKAPAAARGQTIANLKKFLKGAWSELKKVHWPTRREIVVFTGVVLVAVTIVAVLIFLMDAALSRLLGLFFRTLNP